MFGVDARFENVVAASELEKVNDIIDRFNEIESENPHAMPLGMLIWFPMLVVIEDALGEEMMYIDLDKVCDEQGEDAATAIIEEMAEKLKGIRNKDCEDGFIKEQEGAE